MGYPGSSEGNTPRRLAMRSVSCSHLGAAPSAQVRVVRVPRRSGRGTSSPLPYS